MQSTGEILGHPFESASDAPSPREMDTRASFDERLNHILEAATDLIARVGYQEASMREVAKAAGVSLAGLYHYFDSKEKMLFLIQFRTFNSLLNNLREKLHGVSDPVEQLQVMVRTHVEYFAANLAALKVCSHEMDSLTGTGYDETRKIRRLYYDETRAIVDRLISSGTTQEKIDPHVSTMCLFSSLNWLYRWYNPREGRPPSAVARQITNQFLHGIAASPTPKASAPPT